MRACVSEMFFFPKNELFVVVGCLTADKVNVYGHAAFKMINLRRFAVGRI